MKKIHLSAVTFGGILLLLQINLNNAMCKIAQPSVAIDIESYSADFNSDMVDCIIQSYLPIPEIIRNFREKLDGSSRFHFYEKNGTFNIVYSKPQMTPQKKLLQMMKKCETILTHYKNIQDGKIPYEKGFALRFLKEHFSGENDEFFEYHLNPVLFSPFEYQDEFYTCWMRESPIQYLADLLRSFQYVTALVVSSISAPYGIFHKEASPSYFDYVKKIKSRIYSEYLLVAKYFHDNLNWPSVEYTLCDTSEPSSSGTLIELKAFQKYLFSEDQISPGYPGPTDSCLKKCTDVNEMSNPIVCRESDEMIRNDDNDHLCWSIKKCKKIQCSENGDRTAYRVCESPRSDERYQFYSKGSLEDNNKTCSYGYSIAKLGSTERSSRGRWVIPKPCHTCECTCLDNEYFVNVNALYADENMVVVGAQFVLMQNTLHIKLRQAKILPNGLVDASTASWKSADDDSSIHMKLRWEDLRAFDFSKTDMPKDKVLTGLRFLKISNENEEDSSKKQRFALATHSTQYDFISGRLNGNKTWHFPKAAENELKLQGDGPANLNTGHRLVSTANKFVVLTTTGSLTNGGQNTIPYFDGRQVVPQTLAPLAGAELVYNSREGSGGFIGLKLLSYNYRPYINLAKPYKWCCDD